MSILNMKQILRFTTLCIFTCFVGIANAAESNFWKINHCSISGTSADITLSTDASISNNKVHFKLKSAVPLKNAPEIELNTARFTGFDLEGTGSGFGFEVEYTPMQVSYLLKPEAALVAAYKPIYADDGSFYTYHAIFPMQELPALIAKISENCNSFAISQR